MPEQKQFMDPASPQEQALAARISEKKEFIDQAAKDLAPISHRGRLPESKFKEIFVPFFAGQVQSTPENNLINTWVAISGSPASEVDIIDDEGQVLFSTPPLYDTVLIDPASPTERTLGDIMTEYVRLQQDIPQAAEGFINGHLQNKLKNMFHKPEEVLPVNNRWTQILKDRYGIGLQSDAEVKASEEASRDTLDYDAIE